MPRSMLRLLPCLLLVCLGPVSGRTLSARIAQVVTPVATLEGVTVRLDWPAQATQGSLSLTAKRVAAQDLGYRFADIAWDCPLLRDIQGGWRCDGVLRSGRAKPMRLSLDLGVASTDATLSQGSARFALHRQAATPDLTSLDLTRVPMAWAQALATQAWPAGRFKSGTLDGRLTVEAADDKPLRIQGPLSLAGIGLDTPDGSIAAEGVSGRFDIDYRKAAAASQVSLSGALKGGELLAGNAYLLLPATPVSLRIDATQSGSAGWRLPRIEWRDGERLQATGSAALSADGALRDLDLSVSSRDIAPLRQAYLSGWLGLAGLGEVALAGAIGARLQMRDGELRVADARLHGVDVRDAQQRFVFEGLDGDVRYSADAPVASELRWRGGQLQGLDFGAAALPFDSRDGVLRLRRPAAMPMLGGRVEFSAMALRPPAGDAGLRIEFGMEIDSIDFGKVSAALGLPAFTGELSGHIPKARYADDRIDFDGGLALHLFDGSVQVSSLAMERPFGVAPTLSADIALQGIDLQALTGVFDFGSISGRLDGRIDDLRLVDWGASAFDAEFHTVPRSGVRQRISQRAVQNISSVGDASFVGSLQGQLIGLFDDFGYARIGISCRLENEVCEMGGLHSANGGFTIVEGAGIPRLNVVGYNRQVDWPTLVERLAAVGKGDVKPVFE
ncbi:hypothetical protein M2650_05005 [Luteimonas sp. SX5]|uniref:Dicarboxylate transport domain-containing protein n=1 Tax=Luteimonas galliterrae TaxID=2940486 RepID=A0ABT0MGJ9_9GAMM|nr:hypothetical protein [Luteimonas galliterrae]MCL1634001.1 hypothetical protein [Luteimonas galliterrae]